MKLHKNIGPAFLAALLGTGVGAGGLQCYNTFFAPSPPPPSSGLSAQTCEKYDRLTGDYVADQFNLADIAGYRIDKDDGRYLAKIPSWTSPSLIDASHLQENFRTSLTIYLEKVTSLLDCKKPVTDSSLALREQMDNHYAGKVKEKLDRRERERNAQRPPYNASEFTGAPSKISYTP